MSRPRIRLAMGALAGAFVVGGNAAAQAHALCGDRTTLAIDDPGVTDELALLALEWLPRNPDRVGQLDACDLDDIFPDSIGKAIFSQSLPMFTGARQ